MYIFPQYGERPHVMFMYLEVVKVSGVRRNLARDVDHPGPVRRLRDQVQETARDHVGR